MAKLRTYDVHTTLTIKKVYRVKARSVSEVHDMFGTDPGEDFGLEPIDESLGYEEIDGAYGVVEVRDGS